MSALNSGETRETLVQELHTALRVYYTNYYHHELGLPDWEERVERRINEEENFAEPILERIERWINYDFDGKRVLVVGAGTGAEAFALKKKRANVTAIEPDTQAVEILWRKADLAGLGRKDFVEGRAEALGYPDESFDFVYCYTVLEHVQDVPRSIAEMIRVCKADGYVFLETPDYRYPYDGHYKLILFPFLPRFINRLWLRLQGRPPSFLDTINFITLPELSRELWKHNVITMRVSEPVFYRQRFTGVRYPFLAWFTRAFGIEKEQYIFLRKWKK